MVAWKVKKSLESQKTIVGKFKKKKRWKIKKKKSLESQKLLESKNKKKSLESKKKNLGKF